MFARTDRSQRIANCVRSLKILRDANALPARHTLPHVISLGRRSGPASAASALASIHGDAVAVMDPKGSITYRDLGVGCNAVTNGLRGLTSGQGHSTVGLMCRNSRYLLFSMLGAAGLGAKIVLLNADLGARQIAEVCAREQIGVVIYDAEFSSVFDLVGHPLTRLVAWSDEDAGPDSLDALIANSSCLLPPRPPQSPSIVMLTSGTSGSPKGASRGGPSLETFAGLLEKIPLRGSDRILVCSPMFHGWGLIVSAAAMLLGATLVFDRRFDAERTVDLVVKHRCNAIIAVPTMLRRLMALGSTDLARIDHGRLRIIGSGGAKLDVALVNSIAAEFGPVLYNLYGATEASFITIAGPHDLATAPATAGRAALGVEIAIVQDNKVVPTGTLGEICARSGGLFVGYTNGTSKSSFLGMMMTGDTGRLDDTGLLFVEGRADTMIVSGGENVFPEEVESVLVNRADIFDAKVVAVTDDVFGQRLCAFVVVVGGTPAPTIEELKTYVGSELSRSRVPRDVVFVPEIPRTATGKVTRASADQLLTDYGTASSARRRKGKVAREAKS